MNNIIYIPIDERPCNYKFPYMLSRCTGLNLIEPPLDLLGDKKKPADTENLFKWLFENAKRADGAIISTDMLIYGGLIPSRLHSLSFDECTKKVGKLKELKKINPDLKIFAASSVMRCPSYSSSDEEPDYYDDYGEDIFKFGYIRHKQSLNAASVEETIKLNNCKQRIPESIIKDYENRRKINREVNSLILTLVKEGLIDFMSIPQDDSAPYGYTSIDQQYIKECIDKNDISLKVYMYPGSDEVGCTLLARMINELKGKKPLVYVRYDSINGPGIIPLYEDRPLHESIKYQILCAGGLTCTSLSDADMVLMVNCPGEKMIEAWDQDNSNKRCNMDGNIVEFVEYMDYVINTVKKPCMIADVAYSNGADLKLVNLLSKKGLLFKAASFAGWNTSSNTLGTTICQGMIYNIYGISKSHLDFLALRYVEDAGYCAYVRQKIADEYLPGLGMSYDSVDGKRGSVSKEVKKELEKFIDNYLVDKNFKIKIDDCYMPWDRMFEVGLNVTAESKI